VKGARARAWWLAGALCLSVVVVDQIAKAIVRDQIVVGEQVHLAGPLDLTLSHNSGVAFGIASGGAAPLVIFALIALAFVGYLLWRNPERQGMWVAAGLVAGGAIGNMIDRLRTGSVTDFVEIGSWPPFNLADVAITAGVIVFALIFLREGDGGPG
jgi:signal peptidase II